MSYLEVGSAWSRVPTGELDWTLSREFETENLLMGFEIWAGIRSISCVIWIRCMWRYIWSTGCCGFVVLSNVRFLDNVWSGIFGGQSSDHNLPYQWSRILVRPSLARG